MRILYTLTLLLALNWLGSCTAKTDENAASHPEEEHTVSEEAEAGTVHVSARQFIALDLQLGHVTQKNLSEIVRANGYLKLPPQNKALISPILSGIVTKIMVREGEAVKANQVLAVLEHPDFIKLQEDYLKTKNETAFLQQEFERQQTLFRENVGAGKTFERAKADLGAAKARLNSLEKQLRMLHVSTANLSSGNLQQTMSIRAPIGGYVSMIGINLGSMAQPGTPMFEVIDTRHLHVDLLVYEQDLFKVKKGQKVRFVLTNQNNNEIEGEIFTVGKAFENDTKSIAVHAEIKNNENYGLIPGMYVNALIDVGTQTTAALPDDAIVRSGDNEIIFVRQPSGSDSSYTFVRTPVKTGVQENGFTAITFLTKPQQPNPEIITSGAFYVYSILKTAEEGGDVH